MDTGRKWQLKSNPATQKSDFPTSMGAGRMQGDAVGAWYPENLEKYYKPDIYTGCPILIYPLIIFQGVVIAKNVKYENYRILKEPLHELRRLWAQGPN